MLSGEYYDASDDMLVREREYAKGLIFEFNHTRPDDKGKRKEIISRLIKAKGSFHIEAPFYCDYGYNIEVGENVTIGAGSVVIKDIPDSVSAAGNPCRIIRRLQK